MTFSTHLERVQSGAAVQETRGSSTARKGLLACGVLAPLLYVAMNVFIPLRWPGYSFTSQTISEVSAVGAPTRAVWVLFGIIYGLLVTAFGWGVWMSARGNRSLRILGGLLLVSGAVALSWPPMHQREVLAAGGGTLTDILHIVWSFVTVLLFVLVMVFGGAALGKRFRLFSIATAVILLVFGVLTGMDAPAVQANLPTPWLGVWERISAGAYMVWVAVLALVLLRTRLRVATRH